MLPSPSSISIENTDAVRESIACLLGVDKGERFVGVTNRYVAADNGCNLKVCDPSNKIKNGAREVGIGAVPMIAAVKTLVASYRFIESYALLVGFARLISAPRGFVCLRNNNSSFL